MSQYVNAVYYPHHPNMMAGIYNIVIEQILSNHIRSSKWLYPFILMFSSFVIYLAKKIEKEG